MRTRGRTDLNQKKIVKELRARGMSVRSTANLGAGFPDICVGYQNVNYLFEIKTDEKKRLTKDELDFFTSWSGQVHRVNSVDDVIKIIMDN